MGLDPIDAYATYSAACETSEPEMLGNRLRVSWIARPDGEETYTGTDFIEFAADGRVSQVTMFYDSTPD
jgi:hypothetical protein